MWDTTVSVTRSAVMAADHARMAEFMATAGLWTVMPGSSYAFQLPESPSATGRLLCLVGAAPDGVAGGIVEVMDETPGELIRFGSRSTNPVGKRLVTLSVREGSRGLDVQLGVQEQCARPQKAWIENAWRKTIRTWLEAVDAVLAGRRPWPSTEMPADVQRAWLTGSAPGAHEMITAGGVIRASIGSAWPAIRSPDTPRLLGRGISTGRVPGTPAAGVGEMTYTVRQHAGDRLSATILVVADIVPGQSVLTRRVGRPRGGLLTSLEATDGGTRLTLTGYLATPVSDAVRDTTVADLNTRVRLYQDLLESA